MHEASLVDTCMYESLTSCDDCSTRNVQVWMTSYDLAIHSFVVSNRYLCLWSVKVSETYATEIHASKDDSTVIHVIKDRKIQMKMKQLNHHALLCWKFFEQNTTKFVQMKVEQKSLKPIPCRINLIIFFMSWKLATQLVACRTTFSHDEKRRHNTTTT